MPGQDYQTLSTYGRIGSVDEKSDEYGGIGSGTFFGSEHRYNQYGGFGSDTPLNKTPFGSNTPFTPFTPLNKTPNNSMTQPKAHDTSKWDETRKNTIFAVLKPSKYQQFGSFNAVAVLGDTLNDTNLNTIISITKDDNNFTQELKNESLDLYTAFYRWVHYGQLNYVEYNDNKLLDNLLEFALRDDVEKEELAQQINHLTLNDKIPPTPEKCLDAIEWRKVEVPDRTTRQLINDINRLFADGFVPSNRKDEHDLCYFVKK